MANIISTSPGPADCRRDPKAPYMPTARAIGENTELYRDERILKHEPISDHEWTNVSKNIQTGWHYDYAPDFMTMHNGWVLSQRAFEIFKSFDCLDHCQVVELDPPLAIESDGLDMTDYWYVHVKDKISAIDLRASEDLEPWEMTEKLGGDGLQLSKSAPFERLQIAIRMSVTRTRHCWFDTLSIVGADMFVTDALRDAWIEAGCGPIYFRQCQIIDDREAVAGE